MENIHISIRILNDLLSNLSFILMLILGILYNIQIWLMNKKMKNIELRVDATVKEHLVQKITEEICEKYQINL